MAWKWSGLFEAELHPEVEDLSRWWRAERSGIPVGKMGYRRAVTLAGPRLECEIYPCFGKADELKARAARKNLTKENQRRLNRKRAIHHLVLLADTNFCEKDIHLTLTYKLPPDMDRVRKDVRNFLLRVKRYRMARGLGELKYIYTIEGGQARKNGMGVQQVHVHMLMNGGVSRENLEEIWKNGTDGKGWANADRLKPNDRGLEEIATYIVKQAGDDGGKRWCASRNLKQPLQRKNDARVGNGRVKVIAKNIQAECREEMEKMYPAYRFVECRVFFSDAVDGVYIRVLMRRRDKRTFESNSITGRSG